jgi:peroxiredoxin
MKLKKGDNAPAFNAPDIYGREIDSNFNNDKIFISFLRNVDCIMCNLRVHELIKAKDLFQENNLKVIMFLQSSKEDILSTMIKDSEFPFTVIPDPKKIIYNKYGLTSSMFSTMASMMKVKKMMKAMKLGFEMKISQRGDMHLMPADILISSGIIEHARYGSTSGDHISLEEIIKFASRELV